MTNFMSAGPEDPQVPVGLEKKRAGCHNSRRLRRVQGADEEELEEKAGAGERARLEQEKKDRTFEQDQAVEDSEPRKGQERV